MIIPRWAVNRWKRQLRTDYKDLSESEKDSDRKEARGMAEIFFNRMQRELLKGDQ